MRYVTRDGRVLETSALGACICTKCDELFNSVGAFDAHLAPRKGKSTKPHDFSWMPRNARGLLVTSLREVSE